MSRICWPNGTSSDAASTIIRHVGRGGGSVEVHLGIPTPDEGFQYARLVGNPKLFTVPAIWAEVVTRLATDPPYLR